MAGQWDVDLAVATIYGAAGYLEEEPPGSVALALQLFGIDAIRRVTSTLPGDARLTPRTQLALEMLAQAPYDPRWIIEVRRRLNNHRLVWGVAHELAEWVLKRFKYEEADTEDYANAIAASLIAPRVAFCEALTICGRDFKELAEIFCTTETCMALRYGEVTGFPLVVLKEVGDERRGDPEFIWPSVRKLRQVARNEGTLPAVEAIALSDNDRRTVLLARVV